MKSKNQIIIFALILGLLVWVFNAIIDCAFFKAGTFWSMLYTGLTTMQIVHRWIMLICFLIFGYIIGTIYNKLNNANEELESQRKALDKKLSELDCLYGMSRLSDKPNITIEEILNGVVNLVKPALVDVKRTHARIIFDDKEYKKNNFKECINRKSYRIIVQEKILGNLEVHYESPNENHAPEKVADENSLLEAVSERTGKIIDRIWAKNELKKAHDQLRLLTAHLHSSLEKERLAIAREIHDELGQVLTALKINLSILNRQIKSSVLKVKDDTFLNDEIKDMQNIIDVSIKRVRKLITELRPEVLDKLGLLEALYWQGSEFTNQTGISLEYDTVFQNIELDKDKSIAVFRIYQESLTNIAKHANASKVIVELSKFENNFVMKITDNGNGISDNNLIDNNSFGILGMRERAIICNGTLSIQRNNNKGTTVELCIPQG